MRNSATFLIVGEIGSIFVWIGKSLICVCTAISGYILITQVTEISRKISDPIAPTIVII